MRIQTNISAMNSHRNLGLNNAFTGTNLEKLSSGYRINRAADDAAGLAISEKMRGQIRGLAMAEQNTANGISLIQTAEGGLNETHAILQRMRELAVQSSNGTYDEEVDRVQLDREFQQIKGEIDRIANATEYNGIKLLDGSLGKNTRVPEVTIVAPDGLRKAGTAIIPGSVSSVAFSVGAIDNLIEGDRVQFKFLSNGIEEMFTYTVRQADLETGNEGQGFIRALQEHFGSRFDFGNDLNTMFEAGTDAGIKFTDDFEILARANGFETIVGIGGTVTRLGDADPTDIITVTNESGANDRRDMELDAETRFIEIDGRRFQFVSDIRHLDQGNIAIFVATSSMISAEDTNSIVGQLRQHGYNVTLDPDDDMLLRFEAGGTGRGLTFQIGANGGQDQRVSLFVNAMDSTSIGLQLEGQLTMSLAATDIRTIASANLAIEVITSATNMVSGERAALGAMQNRLEHTMNNLGVAKENLTASESIIRDVDMAKEMMEFTKNQILVQASQAMLAQANQLPQGVLSLLR